MSVCIELPMSEKSATATVCGDTSSDDSAAHQVPVSVLVPQSVSQYFVPVFILKLCG